MVINHAIFRKYSCSATEIGVRVEVHKVGIQTLSPNLNPNSGQIGTRLGQSCAAS
jgi:hypothetical protein